MLKICLNCNPLDVACAPESITDLRSHTGSATSWTRLLTSPSLRLDPASKNGERSYLPRKGVVSLRDDVCEGFALNRHQTLVAIIFLAREGEIPLGGKRSLPQPHWVGRGLQ